MTISILRGVTFDTTNINQVQPNASTDKGVFPVGSLIVDMSSNTLRLGDGATQGGVAVAGGGGGGGSTAWADITGKPTTISGFGITDALTTTLTSDAVIGNNKLKYTASGDGGSQLVLAKTMYSVPNTTVFSSVGSIDLYIDSLSADTASTAFRIFNNTDPDGTVTETSNIFKVDGNTGDVSVTGKVLLPDGSVNANYAGFGNADDLKIFHNGNNSIVRETGTGSLYLQSDNNVILGSDSNTETYVKGIYNGAVELYHDNVKKFETTATGSQITGDLNITGNLTVDGVHPSSGDSIIFDLDDSTQIPIYPAGTQQQATLTMRGVDGVQILNGLAGDNRIEFTGPIKAMAHVDVSNPITASADYNVASVVSNSTGKYDVTFTNALPNANYVVSLSVQTNVSSNHYTVCYYNRTTTGFQVQKFLNGTLDSGASGNFSFVIYQF